MSQASVLVLAARPNHLLQRTLGSMKAIALSLLATVVLAACVAQTNQYYLPIDPALAKEGTVCGSVPFGHAMVPLSNTLHISISVIPSDNSVLLSIQLSLPLGAKVRFSKPEFAIEGPLQEQARSGRLGPFRTSVYGEGRQPGHHEYVHPSELLEGRGRNLRLATPDTEYLKSDLFISQTVIATAPSESMVLIVPAVEVNGKVIGERHIPLHLVRKTGVKACVQ